MENRKKTLQIPKKNKYKNQTLIPKKSIPFENRRLYKFLTLLFLSIPILILFFTVKKKYEEKERKQLAKQTIIIKINYQNQKLEKQFKIRKEQLKLLKKKSNQNTEKNLSFEESQIFCKKIGSRLPKIKELKRVFKKRSKFENLEGIRKIWSSSLNKKQNHYIYDINRKMILIEDRKNIKHGVFCLE